MANTVERVHKSLRIERDLAEKVKSLGVDGESETATYCRVLSFGVAALEGAKKPSNDGEQASAAGLVEALEAHIETLKADNETLRGQLEIKDRQIEALSVITAQAQQTTTKAIEAPQEQREEPEKRRGLFARLFG